MTQNTVQKLAPRYVSDYGEILVVRDHCGVKFLADPVDESISVVVPSGRRANLIRFTFDGLRRFCGRDSHVIVTVSNCRLGFVSAEYHELRIFLQDLPEGQFVDVLPKAEPTVARVAIPRAPVLYGAIALAQPIYVEASVATAA